MARQSFEELREAVVKATSVKLAAIALIHEMRERLEDMGAHPTPEQVRALAADLRQHAEALADAIAGHGEEGEEEAEPATTTKRK